MGTFDAMPPKKTLEHTSSLLSFSTFRKKGSFYFCTNFMKKQTTNHKHLIKHNLKTKLLCTWFSLAWVRTFYIGQCVEYSSVLCSIYVMIANGSELYWVNELLNIQKQGSEDLNAKVNIELSRRIGAPGGSRAFRRESIVLHHHALM